MPVSIEIVRLSWYNQTMDKQEISVEKLIKIIEEKDRIITELNQQNQWLIEQFKLLKNKLFATSSEQINSDQVNLFNEAETSADLTKPEPELVAVKGHCRNRTRLTTDKLPDDLPVEIVEHELPVESRFCTDCGGELHTMGKEIREELKIIPAKAVLVRHIQHVYSCRNCEHNSDHVKIAKAEMPKPVIKGGFASPETISHIAVQKYMMASPLYRQEQEWKQNGILLSRQTMANWLIKACGDWLFPIYEEMKRELIKRTVLHGDETPCQVLKEPGKNARQKSYMWLYRTSGEASHQIVIYEYQPDRGHARPREFLKDFRGYLHADGYEGYHKLPDGIKVVGCLAHLRRKFFDAYKTLPKDRRDDSTPAKCVAYCDKLFELERQFSGLTHEERLESREKLSRPLFNEFYAFIDSMNGLPKSLLGTAVSYAKSQRKYVERYLEDGRLEISNNRAERSIKPFVIGRKNWLFSNTPEGAKASAVYYSLIVTAKENNLNPFEYLSWILHNAPNLGRPGYPDSISDLLPGSNVLPESVYVPGLQSKTNEKPVWDED